MMINQYTQSQLMLEKRARTVLEGMSECSTRYMELECPHCHKEKRVVLTCHVRICGKESCIKARKSRILARMLQITSQFDKSRKPMLITLTLEGHHKLARSLKVKYDGYLRKFIRKFKLRGIRIIEIKLKEGDLFYYHYHLLVDSAYIPQKDISLEWSKITNGSYIVDVRRVSMYNGVGYLVKRSASPMVVNVPGQVRFDGKVERDLAEPVMKYLKHLHKSRFYSVFNCSDAIIDEDEEFQCPDCHIQMDYNGVVEITEAISEPIFVEARSVSNKKLFGGV